MTNIKIASSLALHFVGLPYIWGGDDAVAGFDCSGVVIEVNKSVGNLPRKGDWRAKDLYRLWADKWVQKAVEGCVVFFSTGGALDIYHTEYVYKNGLMIGASGGGGKTLTREDAIKQNAYVKMRPLRKDVFAIVNPFK